MSDKKSRTHTQTPPTRAVVSSPRPGLRLIKTTPEDIVAQITAGGMDSTDKKSASTAKARSNPLVKQLASLADALDAEVAMILKM